MSISFHCSYCNKKIIAQNNAGGRWGNCPSCHNKIYIPNLNPDEDANELTFAPIDETEQEKKKKLMEETYLLSQEILKEREEPDENSPKIKTPPVMVIAPKELNHTIVLCLRKMADGQLGESDAIARSISKLGNKAKEALDRIASDIPDHTLADIPPGVLAGLIRTLRNKIG